MDEEFGKVLAVWRTEDELRSAVDETSLRPGLLGAAS